MHRNLIMNPPALIPTDIGQMQPIIQKLYLSIGTQSNLINHPRPGSSTNSASSTCLALLTSLSLLQGQDYIALPLPCVQVMPLYQLPLIRNADNDQNKIVENHHNERTATKKMTWSERRRVRLGRRRNLFGSFFFFFQ